MKDIKIKQKSKIGIKTLDKTVTWTERVKDPLLDVKGKNNPISDNGTNNVEYADNKIKYYSNRAKDEALHQSRVVASKAKDRMIKSAKKIKENKPKVSDAKNVLDKIKTKDKLNKVKDAPKNAERMKRAAIKTKQIAEKTGKAMIQVGKKITKVLISSIKALINGLSSLIALLGTGGIIALIVIILICLIGLLCSSMFGIFFSNESKSRTVNSVITQINNEIYEKAEREQRLTPNSEIKMENAVLNWKEVIAVYSVKYSDDKENSDIVFYVNEKSISNIRNIFNTFNTVSISKSSDGYMGTIDNSFNTTITPSNPSSSEDDKAKTIIHINIQSKSLDEVMNIYKFTDEQKKNTKELLDKKYDDLWTKLLYGVNVGDFVNWKQKDENWATTPIGTSGKTLGQIGCLATSISILIERSGTAKNIIPFTPQTFVQNMNENGGFDGDGNLQFTAITKFIPSFKFVGRVDLKNKTKTEKYQLIHKYHSKSYYLAVEVKGDTGQHWIAVIDVSGGNVTMADPGSSATDLWKQYNWKNTSQFVYFKVD